MTHKDISQTSKKSLESLLKPSSPKLLEKLLKIGSGVSIFGILVATYFATRPLPLVKLSITANSSNKAPPTLSMYLTCDSEDPNDRDNKSCLKKNTRVLISNIKRDRSLGLSTRPSLRVQPITVGSGSVAYSISIEKDLVTPVGDGARITVILDKKPTLSDITWERIDMLNMNLLLKNSRARKGFMELDCQPDLQLNSAVSTFDCIQKRGLRERLDIFIQHLPMTNQPSAG
jgi:hypothetical protein